MVRKGMAMAENHGHAQINVVTVKIRGPFHPGSSTVARQFTYMYLDYLEYSPHEPVFCATVVIDGTAKYRSEINNSPLNQ